MIQPDGSGDMPVHMFTCLPAGKPTTYSILSTLAEGVLGLPQVYGEYISSTVTHPLGTATPQQMVVVSPGCGFDGTL